MGIRRRLRPLAKPILSTRKIVVEAYNAVITSNPVSFASSSLKPIFFRLWEEVCPLPRYCGKRKRQLCLLNDKEILKKNGYSEFTKVSLDHLRVRLNEENERASAINEKTYKMGLSLSIALTITGYALTALPEQISSSVAKTCISVPIVLGVIYFMVAGVIALGSIRTEPIYGSTTQILLLGEGEQQQCLAKCLAQSEVMNSIRHLRNEAVYRLLRMGHYFLLFAIVLVVVSHVVGIFAPPSN